MRSFSRKGTPRKGPSGSAREAASARAVSKRGMMTAFSPGVVRSMRAIAEARRHLRPELRAGRARRRENARYEERRTDQPSLTHHRPVPYADRRLPSTVPRRKHDGGRIRDPSPAECNRSDRTYEQIRFALPAAGALDQVQLTVALGWLVVTVKLVAVPTVSQTTPPEPVKPGSALHAPVAYVLVSTNAASWAVAALRAPAATRALKPPERYAENCGIAIAARMPMIATTTSSSINVKPLDFFRFILETLLILSPLAGWVLVCLDTCRDALAVVGSPRSKRGATGEKAQRSKGDGAKGHRFAAGMDGATSRVCVRACPAIGAKLTGGTIPSPAERKAHVGRHPQGSRRGGSGGAPAGDAGRPGTAGRGP